MTTSDDIITLRKMLPEHGIAMLTTRTNSGELHSRPVTTQEVDDTGQLWFIVSAQANWVAGLSAGEAVNLGYTDDDDRTWVSIAGGARVVEDSARVDRYRDGNKHAGRIEEADVRLLVVEPTTVEYWDAPSNKLAALAMKAASIVGSSRADGRSGSLDI